MAHVDLRYLRVAPALLAMVAALPARALDLPPRAEDLLARGRPWVEVKPDTDDVSGVVRAAIDVPAPQAVVWRLMTDCDLAPKLVASMKSCRILERDPDGRWDVREQVSKPVLWPSVRTVYREEFEKPDRMRFRRTGGDLKVFEGEWRLAARGEVTRVTYEARVAAPFRVPGWVSRIALRRDLANALAALRREAGARANEG